MTSHMDSRAEQNHNVIFNCNAVGLVSLLEEMMEWGDDVIQEVSINELSTW